MTQVDMAETGQDGAGRRETGSGTRRAGNRRDTGAGTCRARIRRAIRAASRLGPWKRGLVLAALALLLGLFMLLHAKIPNRIGNLGSLVETFLPWFGLFIPVLLAGALWRRSASAVVALLLPVVVWLNLFGGLLGDKSRPGGDLTVAEHNVGADNPDPVGTARDLAASGADVLALVELTEQARGVYEKGLAQAYPYQTVQGTVGCGASCRCRTRSRSTSRWTPGRWRTPSRSTSRWPTSGRCAPRWPRTRGRWRCMWHTWGPYG